MKNFKLLSVLAISLMAFAFTSCDTGGDNGYSYLTQDQQKAYQSNMAGYYTDMKIIWEHKNDADVNSKTDSVDTSVNISYNILKEGGDSTMTVSNFPIAKLAEHINNAELKEAISNVTPQTVKVRYMVLPSSTQTIAYIQACPEPIKLNLTYGTDNKEHEVILYFVSDSYYAGYCQWSSKQMGFPFYLYYIYVDGKQTDYLRNSTNTSRSNVSMIIRNAWKSNK